MEPTNNTKTRISAVPLECRVGQFDDFPHVTPGCIRWGALRKIIDWNLLHGIESITQETLDCCKDEGMSAARAGLELGLIDYGEASGYEDC